MGALTKIQLLLKHMQFIGLLQSIDIPFPKIYIDFSSLSNLISLDPAFLQSLDQNFPVFTFRLQFFFIAVALPLIIMMLTLLVFINFTTIMWMCFSLSGILLLAIRVAGEFNQSFVTGGDIKSIEYLVVMICTLVYCAAYRLLGKVLNRYNLLVVLAKNLLSSTMLFAGGCMVGLETMSLRIMLTASCANLLCYVYKADRPKGVKFLLFLFIAGGCAAAWTKMEVSFKGVFPEALVIPGYMLIALGAAGWLQFLMYSNSDKGVGRAFIAARKKMQNLLDKSLLAVSFFFLSSSFVPVVTTCLQMFVCDTYNCPTGTKFNPFLPVDYSKPENATLRDQYCDPCIFQNGCPYTSSQLCPEFNETRLYFHPDTSCDDRVSLYYKISAGIVLLVFVVVVSAMYYVIIETITGQLRAFTAEMLQSLQRQYEVLHQRYITAKTRTEERDQLRRVRSSMIRQNIANASEDPLDDLTWSSPMTSMDGNSVRKGHHQFQSPFQSPAGHGGGIDLGASVGFATTIRTTDDTDDDDDPFDDKHLKAPASPQHDGRLNLSMQQPLLSTNTSNKSEGQSGMGGGNFSPYNAAQKGGQYVPPPPLLQHPRDIEMSTSWRPQTTVVPAPPVPQKARSTSLFGSLRNSVSPKLSLQEEELKSKFAEIDKEEELERRAKAPEPPTMNDALLKVNAKIEPKASSLYNAYRREFQYFLLLEIFHRLALVVVSVFISPKYALAAGINLGVHAGYLVIVLVVRPYVGKLEQFLAIAVALSDTMSSGYATLLWRLPENEVVTSEGLGFFVLGIGVLPIVCGGIWQIVDMRKSLVNPYAKEEEKEKAAREEKAKSEIAKLQEKIDNSDLFGLSAAKVEECKAEIEKLKAPVETPEMKLTDALNTSTKKAILRFFVLGSIPLLLGALGLCVYATLNDPGQEFLNGSDSLQRTQALVLADRGSWNEFTTDCCCFISLEPIKGFNITERWACAQQLNATMTSTAMVTAGATVSRNRQSRVESTGLPIRGVCKRTFAMANCSVLVDGGVVSLDCPEAELDAANITRTARRILW